MSIVEWIQSDWFTLLQSIGIVGGLVFTASALRMDIRTRRTENVIRLTERHHGIWSQLHVNPRLARVLDPKADLQRLPLSTEEELFVLSLILHLSSVYEAKDSRLLVVPENLEEDIKSFFFNPIPLVVWKKYRSRLDTPFRVYVEKVFLDA